MNFHYLNKKIFCRLYLAVNGYLPLMPLLDLLKWKLRRWNTRNWLSELIEDYGSLSKSLLDIKMVPEFSSE
jgi:hypothetical protein